MPYIKEEDRIFDEEIEAVAEFMGNEGNLNYAITKLCHAFIKRHGKCYSTLNTVHGVLNCADKELYRRVTAAYEDSKIQTNGDV